MEQLKTHPMEQPVENSKELPMESTWNPPKKPRKFSKEPKRNSSKKPPLRNYEEPLVCKGGPRYPYLIKRDEQTNMLKSAD